VEATSPQPTSIVIEQVVLRCGCDNPSGHADLGLPCPTPRASEDKGVVAAWYATPDEPTPPRRIRGVMGRIRREIREGL
jgi:hypothetical protein